MPKEYVTFVNTLQDLPKDDVRELFIKDLTPENHKQKYDTRYVRARISAKGQQSGGDILWVRFRMGVLHPKPFVMEILEELGEVPPVRPGQPVSRD